jgi:riboflavin kinase/FMN adenylyltransferase
MVVHGNKLGRKLGFPTANLKIESPLKLIPAGGSYAVKVIHNGCQYLGMLNIGTRPTVDGTKQAIEVHIFDFEKEIYSETLQIQFVRLIRFEQKFENIDALSLQLANDKLVALKYLS